MAVLSINDILCAVCYGKAVYEADYDVIGVAEMRF